MENEQLIILPIGNQLTWDEIEFLGEVNKPDIDFSEFELLALMRQDT